MYKYIYPLIKWKIKPWLKYYIVKKGEGTPSEIITLASPITLANSLRRKFIKFIVGGNSVQDGEPSPTNEVPIQNVTGDVDVKVENKNLAKEILDKKFALTGSGQNRTVVASSYYIAEIIAVKSNTNYTVSGDFSTTPDKNIRVGMFDEYPTVNSVTTKFVYGKSGFNFTTDTNTKYILLYNSRDLNDVVIKNFFVCETEYADSYVPHEEQTAIFPLEEGQILHEGDTIEDKIVQRRKTVIFDGSNDEGWYLQNNTFRCRLANAKYNGKVLSNYFIDRNTDDTGDYIWIFLDGYVLVKFPSISIVEEFTTWLSTHNLTVEYELETPIEIPFTEAQRTAKAQIDKLYSYKGTTHISSTNEPSPIFEVQYYMEGE